MDEQTSRTMIVRLKDLEQEWFEVGQRGDYARMTEVADEMNEVRAELHAAGRLPYA